VLGRFIACHSPIGRIGRAALEEAIGRKSESDPAIGPLDQRILARGDEAALGKFEVPAVVGCHKLADFFDRAHEMTSVRCNSAR
jgi:hypothetical protein